MASRKELDLKSLPDGRREGDAGQPSCPAPPSREDLWRKVVPTGKSCGLCGNKDDAPDPVFATTSPNEKITRVWGYKPRVDAKGVWRNSGTFCLYCCRVWEARYRHKHTISAPAAAKGKDPDLCQKFDKYLELATAQFVAKGGLVPIDWAKVDDQALSVVKQSKVEWVEPDVELWELSYYTKVHGDPDTNDLGHKRAEVNGVKGVLVPTAPIFKIRKKDVNSTQLVSNVGSKDTEIGEGGLAQVFKEISGSLGAMKASGKVIGRVASPPAPSPKAAPQEPAEPGTGPTPRPPTATTAAASSGGPEVAEPAPLMSMFGAFATGSLAKDDPPAPLAAEQPRGGKGSGRAKPKGSSKKDGADGGSQGGAASKRPRGEGGEATGSPDGKKARGRPKRDLLYTVEEFLSKAKSKHENDPGFFGADYKTQARFVQRLQHDVSADMKDEEDSFRKDKLALGLKGLHALKTVLASYHTAGLRSPGFTKTFSDMVFFLKSEPAAPDPFPDFLHRTVLKGQALGLTGQAFWRCVTKDSLASVGVAEDDFNKERATIISEKVVALTKKGQTVDDVRKALKEVFTTGFDGQSDLDLADLPSGTRSEIRALTLLVNADATEDAPPANAIHQAVKCLNDSGSHLAKSLVAFPKGRAIVDEAVVLAKALETKSSKLDAIGSHLASMSKASMAITAAAGKTGDLLVGCKELASCLAGLNSEMAGLRENVLQSMLTKEFFEKTAEARGVVFRSACRCLEELIGATDAGETAALQDLRARLGQCSAEFQSPSFKTSSGESEDEGANCEILLQLAKDRAFLLKDADSDPENSVRNLSDALTVLQYHEEFDSPVGAASLRSLMPEVSNHICETFKKDGRLVARAADVLRAAAAKETEAARRALPVKEDAFTHLCFFADGKVAPNLQECSKWFWDETALRQAEAFADQVGDRDFRGQLAVVNAAIDFAKAGAQVLLQKPPGGEPDSAQAKLVCGFSVKLSALRGLIGNAAEGAVLSNSARHCITFLDGVLAQKSAQALLAQGEAVLRQYGAQWTERLQALSAELEDKCPSGWQAHKEALMSNPQVQKALLENPSYDALCKSLGALDQATSILLPASGVGRAAGIISPAAAQRASQARELGRDTVACTYVLYQLDNVLKGISQKTKLRAEIGSMREAMRKKGLTITDELNAVLGDMVDSAA